MNSNDRNTFDKLKKVLKRALDEQSMPDIRAFDSDSNKRPVEKYISEIIDVLNLEDEVDYVSLLELTSHEEDEVYYEGFLRVAMAVAKTTGTL